jgi:GntR family transcriptional repressor for pyruvate dehydrogenase complex
LSGGFSYEEVRSLRLYEQVAEQLRSHIIEGELQPGDKLPSESELAEQFAISRTVVREALQTLHNQQLVEVKHGRGAFVCEPTPDTIAGPLSTLATFRGASVFDLHDVREILEVEVATLAALNASDEEKEHLSRLLELMEQEDACPREYVALDLLFHRTLAEATGNPVFFVLIEALADLLIRSRLRAIQAPGGLGESLEGHKAICRAVEEGNPQLARAAMRQHLGSTKSRLSWLEGTGSQPEA